MFIAVSLLMLTGMVARFSLGEDLGVQTQGGFVVATYIKSLLLLVVIASKDAAEPWFHVFNSNLKARRKEESQLSRGCPSTVSCLALPATRGFWDM